MNTYAGWFFFTVPSPFQHSGSKATFHLFLWNVLSAFCRSLWQISKCTPLFQHLLLRYIIIIKNLFVKQKNEPEVPIHFTFALSLFTGEVFFPLPFNQSHNSIMFRLRALAFHTNSRYKTLARKFFTLLLLSRFPGSWINASPPFSYNFLYNGYLRRHSPYTVTGSLRPCTWFPFHLFCAVSIDALNSSMELY